MSLDADFRSPSKDNPMVNDMDTIRNNFNLLLTAAVSATKMAPGWSSVVDVSDNNDYSQPDAVELTRGTRVITIHYDYL